MTPKTLYNLWCLVALGWALAALGWLFLAQQTFLCILCCLAGAFSCWMAIQVRKRL